MSKQKLAYVYANGQLNIKLHTAEGKNEIGPADLIKEVSFNVADFPASFADSSGEKSLALYGLTKLLQDRTSQCTESVESKFDAMVAEAARLQELDAEGVAQWRKAVVRAEGVARSTKKVDPALVYAIAQLKGVSDAVATSNLQSLAKEQIEALVASPKVAEKIAEYKAQLADAKESAEHVDLADLLM